MNAPIINIDKVLLVFVNFNYFTEINKGQLSTSAGHLLSKCIYTSSRDVSISTIFRKKIEILVPCLLRTTLTNILLYEDEKEEKHASNLFNFF